MWKQGNGEEVSGWPSGTEKAPKLGNGKSPLSFFHCHLHTLEIEKKIGTN